MLINSWENNDVILEICLCICAKYKWAFITVTLHTHTTNLTDSSLQFSITGSHSPLAGSGHVTTSSHLSGLPVFPV